jgi:hypothetical protein
LVIGWLVTVLVDGGEHAEADRFDPGGELSHLAGVIVFGHGELPSRGLDNEQAVA